MHRIYQLIRGKGFKVLGRLQLLDVQPPRNGEQGGLLQCLGARSCSSTY